MSKINQLIRAYAYHYGAGVISSSIPKFDGNCSKLVGLSYEGEERDDQLYL